jgi:pimeloyl-ACP methyl ester carboxylesterase/DNA-binding CsgD family transcriptional regulator
MEQRIRLCLAPDGVRLAYAVSGHGPPLVKAAQWLSHLDHDWRSPVWRHWMRELSIGHTLIRYDERGCGLSDWDVSDFSFEAWVRDLETIVDARGLGRFPLLGVSQGAAVAVAFAARHPERVSALVLYGGYARGRLRRDPTPEQIEEADLLLRLVHLGWGQQRSAFCQVFSRLFMPDAPSERIQWLDELQARTTSAENAVRFESAFFQIDVSDAARLVRAPTLVLHARDDAMVPFEEGRILSSLIPDARVVPLDGQNHVIQEDEPSWPVFLEAVRDFLRTSGSEAEPIATNDPFPELTDRERAVLELIAQGTDNARIAGHLSISPKTVRNHITSIFRKLGVETRPQAIVAARTVGFGRIPAEHGRRQLGA